MEGTLRGNKARITNMCCASIIHIPHRIGVFRPRHSATKSCTACLLHTMLRLPVPAATPAPQLNITANSIGHTVFRVTHILQIFSSKGLVKVLALQLVSESTQMHGAKGATVSQHNSSTLLSNADLAYNDYARWKAGMCLHA